MLNFLEYLTEVVSEPSVDPETGAKLKHLMHNEDEVIYNGHKGVGEASKRLEDIHNYLSGKPSKHTITTKYDGAPSIVFGRNPENGLFFVATKSAFNKTPKINYTDQDIDQNHGHSKDLAEKLKYALKHLSKVSPKHGIFQGDLMYTDKDVTHKDGKYSFTPNTITYSTNRASQEGKKVRNSKLGVVVHSMYGGGKNLNSMSVKPFTDHSVFANDPSVNIINPKLNISDRTLYTPEMQNEYRNHMENAKRHYSTMDPTIPDIIKDHEIDLEAHVNDMVKTNKNPSSIGFLAHLQKKMDKDLAATKTPKFQQQKSKKWQEKLKHFSDHKDHLDQLFQLHGHMQKAKNVLIRGLNSAGDYETSINGNRTNHEGYVAFNGNKMSKLVNRNEFSRLNATIGGIQKKKETIKNV
jgi:Family of unknown function (DUF6267)